MKKLFIALIGLMTFATVHAQQTVVIQRPGLFTDLANAATALVELPAALATGIVTGTAEVAGSMIHGNTTVITTPAPAVSVVPGYTTPIVTTPAPVIVRQVPVAPPVVTTTTTTTSYGGSVTIQTVRPASGYELPLGGTNYSRTVIAPVPVEHRVGPSPYVNPYVWRP